MKQSKHIENIGKKDLREEQPIVLQLTPDGRIVMKDKTSLKAYLRAVHKNYTERLGSNPDERIPIKVMPKGVCERLEQEAYLYRNQSA